MNKFIQGDTRSIRGKLQNIDEKYLNIKNKGKSILCSWTGRINIAKTSMLFNMTYRFDIIHIKILMAFFFTEVEKQPSYDAWLGRDLLFLLGQDRF